jgi:tungstate transport system substrate-binding protein
MHCLRTTWCAVAISVLLGCSIHPTSTIPKKTKVLRLATTTSFRDSGLLDELLPIFERETDCRVDVIGVGTGAALRLGEMGEVDVVVVHSRPAEEAFMANNHGYRHEEFMTNEFVIVGPADDPGGIRNLGPVEAFNSIAKGKHRFVSRGDNSGTHQRELSLWQLAGGRPNWNDYIEVGQGMGPSLMVASEKQAYVLADNGTFLKFEEKIELVRLGAHSTTLNNPYSVLGVNLKKHPKVNSRSAEAFIDFLVSERAQRIIGDYKIGDRNLFLPTRIYVGQASSLSGRLEACPTYETK